MNDRHLKSAEFDRVLAELMELEIRLIERGLAGFPATEEEKLRLRDLRERVREMRRELLHAPWQDHAWTAAPAAAAGSRLLS